METVEISPGVRVAKPSFVTLDFSKHLKLLDVRKLRSAARLAADRLRVAFATTERKRVVTVYASAALAIVVLPVVLASLSNIALFLPPLDPDRRQLIFRSNTQTIMASMWVRQVCQWALYGITLLFLLYVVATLTIGRVRAR